MYKIILTKTLILREQTMSCTPKYKFLILFLLRIVWKIDFCVRRSCSFEIGLFATHFDTKRWNNKNVVPVVTRERVLLHYLRPCPLSITDYIVITNSNFPRNSTFKEQKVLSGVIQPFCRFIIYSNLFMHICVRILPNPKR